MSKNQSLNLKIIFSFCFCYSHSEYKKEQGLFIAIHSFRLIIPQCHTSRNEQSWENCAYQWWPQLTMCFLKKCGHITLGVGSTGWLEICNLWLMIMIISWCSDFAFIDILQDNFIAIHHNICLTEGYKMHTWFLKQFCLSRWCWKLEWVETLDYKVAGASLNFKCFSPLSVIIPLSASSSANLFQLMLPTFMS